MSIRVRYAPSPTGNMHLGGIRTALYNYLYAKKMNGIFILRIQDTDRNRHNDNSIQNIKQTLQWLKLIPDQSPFSKNQKYGPYIQSQRLNIYKQYQKILLKSGLAYPCFCQNIKHHQKNQKQSYAYDKTCRKLSIDTIKTKIKNGQAYAVRIKSDIQQFRDQYFQDQVYGTITASDFDDFIIVKKDGWPTFHFANVIDDWKMKISHVIRGQEWLTNTSKHIYLYKLLKVPIPKYVHLPLLLSPSGKKLSKRDPISSFQSILKQGYLPQSIINFTGLLGWKPLGDSPQQLQRQQQIFSIKQLIEHFNIKSISKNPIKINIKKLDYYNHCHLKQLFNKNNNQQKKYLINKLIQHIPIANQFSQQYLYKVIKLIIDRIKKFNDIKNYLYLFQGPDYQNQKSLKDFKKIFGNQAIIKIIKINSNIKSSQLQSLPQNIKQIKILNIQQNKYNKINKLFHNLRLIFQHIIPKQFTQQNISMKISQLLYQNPIYNNQQVYHLLRYLLTGFKSGPQVTTICQIIGRKYICQLLQLFMNTIKQNNKIN